jgi:superfamily I DNA/RNA helicase
MSPSQKFLFLADAAGFRDRWQAAPPPERARLLDDLRRIAEAVSQAASQSEVGNFGSIASLIEDRIVPLGVAARSPGAVVVDSIVAVKGLRFDHVFVAGVAHERFPRIYTSHAMAFSRTYGLIVRENVTRGAAQTAKFAWYYARFGAKAMYLDEERRALAYGVSRARRTATATGFGKPPRWAKEHDLLAGLENGRNHEGAVDRETRREL